eukprot:3741624-Amphidinium_carterae.1
MLARVQGSQKWDVLKAKLIMLPILQFLVPVLILKEMRGALGLSLLINVSLQSVSSPTAFGGCWSGELPQEQLRDYDWDTSGVSPTSCCKEKCPRLFSPVNDVLDIEDREGACLTCFHATVISTCFVCMLGSTVGTQGPPKKNSLRVKSDCGVLKTIDEDRLDFCHQLCSKGVYTLQVLSQRYVMYGLCCLASAELSHDE